MKVIPAIDIKNGKCVRLKKGNFSDITIYSGSPLEQARLFKDNGFDFIHVIDLDGAKKGERINNRIIDQIINLDIKIQIGEEFSFQNLIIKVLKCYNSQFDDDPEVTAYMQVKDTTMNNNDSVFVFNDWTFASSPSITPFDHPVYDVWLKKCYS